MLRSCAFMCLIAMTIAMPPRRKHRTTLAPISEHTNEELTNEWSPSKLSWIEELMRGYPEHGLNQKQGTPVTSAKVQPAIVSATEPPPAFLADYEEQDFATGDFGIQVQEDNIPTKSAGEYPDSAAVTTGSTSHNNQHPETTVSKETSSAIHPNVQTWFDSLAENAEKFDAGNIASFRGVPGVNFPDYEDIPSTPFTCFDKPYLPGFYADMDTGCQVFHMCFDNRKVSFLCPLGTVFNQALLTCDYWQNTDCSRTPLHYGSNAGIGHPNHGKNPYEDTNKYDKEPSEHNTQDHSSSLDTSKGTDVPATQVPTPGKNPYEDTNKYDKEPSEHNTQDHSSSLDTSKGTDVPATQVPTPGTNQEADQSRNSNVGVVSSELDQGKQSSRKPTKPRHEYNFSAYRYLDLFLRFFPIKAKVTMFPENGKTKVEAITSIGNSMRQRISVYPVANNSKIVAVASIGEKRRQSRPQAGGYSTVTKAPEIQNQRKGKDIDQSVFSDIDNAFAIVRRVLEHVGRLLPRTTTVTSNEGVTSNPPISSRRSSCRCRNGSQSHNRQPGHPKHCRCYQPLPTLNPRFIVKPITF